MATGPGPENEVIRDGSLSFGIDCPEIPVDEDDVLGRYVAVAMSYKADVVVRITGDCPLIDAGIVDDTIEALRHHDFATNVERRTFPRGLDCEVMGIDTLLKLDRTVHDERREHVCSAIYDDYRYDVISVQDLDDNSDLIWCVDVEEDLENISVALGWGILPYEELLKRWRKTI